MIKLFDYLFIRTYIQYQKWREDYPYPFAEGVIVVVQGLLVLDVLTLLSIVGLLPKKIEGPKYYALILLLILYLINHHRYSKNYMAILNSYDMEKDIYKKRNGIIIVLLICAITIFPMIIGALRHNLGYDI